MAETASCVGLDVSKAAWAIALRPPEPGWTVANDAPGIASLVARVRAVGPAWSGLEATGGVEVPVTVALATAGWPVAGVHPRQARDFANATGRLAKTAA